MARKLIGRLTGRLRDWLHGKKPQVPEGHRGVGLGYGNQPGPKKTTGEDVNRQAIPKNEVEGFLYREEPLFVYSSNVGMAQYFPKDQKMLVEYLAKKGGRSSAYLYSGVSLQEATSFATAHSKGVWVWDNLRVRGSKTAHRKPFVKIR